MTGVVMRGEDVDRPLTLGRIAALVVLSILAIAGTAFSIGMLWAHIDHGGGAIGPRFAMMLGAAIAIGGGAAFGFYRLVRPIASTLAVAPPRSRMNAIILAGCGVAGALIAIVMFVAVEQPTDVIGTGPIAPGFAIALSAAIGLLLPPVCIYWHLRVADEQEAAAYHLGAMLAMYVFWIGAPVWWLLWRGGLVPAPDGIIIYYFTILVAGIVWMWRKYR